MNQEQELLQELEGTPLENYGDVIFKSIGLTCFSSLGQIKLSSITSGYPNDEHIEFDYIIPNDKVCLIGEITARDNEGKIKNKYDKFVKHINILKNIQFSDEFWIKLGVQKEDIRHFREIKVIKAFFITTKKEKFDVSLSYIPDMAIFYSSDFLKLIEYSKTIGKWTKNYFLKHFNVSSHTNQSITIYEKDCSLIISKNKKISGKDIPLSNLYTFTISPYRLLDIAHVHRKDELPSLQDNTYNYQRLLNSDKLKIIRRNLLNDPDFMFPSDILVILSKECTYTKDGTDNSYLLIPEKYGSISIIDGQHRLFSYADETVKSIMQDTGQIKVTAIDFITSDTDLINQSSAKIFIEINTNQTRVEISHLDQIAYELGSDDPKVIATKIIVTINSRDNFRAFFDINSDKTSQGIVEAGIIIDAVKKITNLAKIKQLENPRVEKTKLKKFGYENLFDCNILDLSQKHTLVEKGAIVFERYFNEIFSIFRYDKPTGKKEIKSSFAYSKFWAGFVDLLSIFIEEGLNWNQVRDELKDIKSNVMELREVDILQIDKSTDPLFVAKDPKIPDASSSPKKTCTFLNKNRQKPVSIQNL
jgi:DGQHR domain-containing protein